MKRAILLSFILSTQSFALTNAELKERFSLVQKRVMKNPSAFKSKFEDLHLKFSKQLCRPGTEEKFWQLYRNYRGDGHYLPKTVDGHLDKETLFRYIPEIKRKRDWIEAQIKSLQKKKNFSSELAELEELEKEIKQLIHLKEIYEDSDNETQKVLYKDKSKYQMIKFRKKFNDFILKVPYLTSYRFPVDHFELRENYDEVKHSENKEQKVRANEVYFYRKIVQDGAEEPNGSSSDRFLRAMIDTLVLKFKDAPEFLDEELRYDFSSALDGLKRQLKRRPRGQIRRLRTWKEKIERQISYYTDLKHNKVKVGTHFETGDEIVKTSVKARQELQEYVFTKLQEVYNFWKTEEEPYRALYVLVTTLFNEVGGVDGNEAMERRDVLGVVINRYFNPKYNFIPTTDWLYPYFAENKSEKMPLKELPWLNVMFKEGEFSYTYYFIHGVVRVFCPDQTRLGKRLRNQNLELALEAISQYDGSFTGLRYFSRASMLGRISMDQLWDDYEPIAERAGRVVDEKLQVYLAKALSSHEYNYHYHFFDPKGQRFKVVEVNEKVYALNLNSKKFHLYRSPHFFKYFSPKR